MLEVSCFAMIIFSYVCWLSVNLLRWKMCYATVPYKKDCNFKSLQDMFEIKQVQLIGTILYFFFKKKTQKQFN